MGEKRCPSCGNWSKWNQQLQDACEHCGEGLSFREQENIKRIESHIQAREENWMFFIKETDPNWLVYLKKTGNFFYTIFMAIISFILWLVAAFPG